MRFQTSSDRLRAGAESSLNAAAETLLENPALAVEVAGYTDNRGDAQFNLRLSERRSG